MLETRQALMSEFEPARKTDLTRPTAQLGEPATSPPQGTPAFLTSLTDTFTFFRLMWAGEMPLFEWRTIGFQELDTETCKQTSYDTSFATGGALLLFSLRSTLSCTCRSGRIFVRAASTGVIPVPQFSGTC